MISIAEGIGFMAAILTTIAFLPQVIKAWKTKSTHDLSYVMIFIFFAGVSLWLVYGLMVSDRPVTFANAFTLVLITVLLFLKLKYK